MQVHATLVRDIPFLALFAWTRDVTADAHRRSGSRLGRDRGRALSEEYLIGRRSGPSTQSADRSRATLAARVKMRLAGQDLSPSAVTEPSPIRLPATRYLPECVAASMFTSPDVAAALAGIEEFLHWRQNPNYSDAVMGHGYMGNYAYAELIGSQRLLRR